MKKRNIFITFALLIILSFLAFGCSELGKVNVKGKQDTSYIVLSNGGSAVQYGNYIYFINGYRSYNDDNDGKQNLFNKVEKGAIYRAELIAGKDINVNYDFSFGTTTQKTFEPSKDPNTFLSIKTTTHSPITGYELDESGNFLTDDDGEYVPIITDVEYADLQLIAPKQIGTAKYNDGGIFIFDEYIFYASPSNKKNKSGKTEVEKTEFYKAKLDGSDTKLIYTTTNESISSPYMFYKFNDAYYLVVLDGTDVVSVKMDKKIRKAVTIAKDVDQLYLSNKKVYYKGMPENTAEDFVYILREAKGKSEGDPTYMGNVLEMKRPDGSNSQIVSANASTTSIVGIHNGTFFYEVDNIVNYNNFVRITNNLINTDGQVDNTAALPQNAIRIIGEFDFDVFDMYSTATFLHPNAKNKDDVYCIASDDNGFYLVDKFANVTVVYDKTAEFVAFENGYLYFTAPVNDKTGGTFNMLMRKQLFVDSEVEIILSTDIVKNDPTFRYDILNDFVVYFADIDVNAPSYTFFKEVLNSVTLSQFKSMEAREIEAGAFIGYRISAETVDEDDLHPDNNNEDDIEDIEDIEE